MTTETNADKEKCSGKCLEKVREALERHHGEESDVELDLKTTIAPETLEMGRNLAPLYYSYRPNPKNQKRKKSFVTFNFCPFCGKEAK